MVTPSYSSAALPLALRDDISSELQRMLDGDIIKQVNALPCICNMVVVRKKSGGLRICMDLRAVNKAIIPNKNPLPTTEELTVPVDPVPWVHGFLQTGPPPGLPPGATTP